MEINLHSAKSSTEKKPSKCFILIKAISERKCTILSKKLSHKSETNKKFQNEVRNDDMK